MNTYSVWWRKASDNRAPEYVMLDEDYTWAGDLQAASPREVARIISVTDRKELDLQDPRDLRVGDVLTDQNNNAVILTGYGIWSVVKIVRRGNDFVDE